MKLPDDIIQQTVKFWGDLLRERKPNFGTQTRLLDQQAIESVFGTGTWQRMQHIVHDDAQITVFENVLAYLLAYVDVGYPDWSYSLHIDYSDSEGNSFELIEACRLAGIDVRCLPWKTASYSSVHNGIQVRIRNGDRTAL